MEGVIQDYKGQVSKYESDATGCEERLGLLKEEGECRTWQCSCVWIWLLLLICECAYH